MGMRLASKRQIVLQVSGLSRSVARDKNVQSARVRRQREGVCLDLKSEPANPSGGYAHLSAVAHALDGERAVLKPVSRIAGAASPRLRVADAVARALVQRLACGCAHRAVVRGAA